MAPTQFRDNCSAVQQSVHTHCTLPRFSGSPGYEYECYGVPYVLVTDEGACDRAWTSCASLMKSQWQAQCTEQGLASAEAAAANAASTERLQTDIINLLKPIERAIADLAVEPYVADVSLWRQRVGAAHGESANSHHAF